jgi:hypothetical protein
MVKPAFLPAEEPTDGCSGDAVGLSDASLGCVLEDGDPVDVEWPPADMPAFQAGAAHPARTRSMMRFRSSSAMAPMMITTAARAGRLYQDSRGS